MSAQDAPVTVAEWQPGPADEEVARRLARLLLGPADEGDDE